MALPAEEISSALHAALQTVAKAWTKRKRHADRDNRVRASQLKAQQRQELNLKEAAWQVMEQAYRLASDHGALPANARQIMYAARPLISELTTRPLDSVYFTQHLLPDFLEAHPELTAGWDVVFDARGHFLEPHTRQQFGIGTVEVRAYVQGWASGLTPTLGALTLPQTIATSGPSHRYHYVLFIEKEGFYPLLERAQIAEKFDLAIMSTKGQTVTAARRLMETLSQQDVTILVLHDFDKSGLEILDKFHANTRRYAYTETPRVLDLGLRLADAQTMGLQREPVSYTSKVNPRESLRRCGATEAECALLVQRHTYSGWEGERIELNAMTSQQFVTWLEQTLVAAGVQKVVPDPATVAAAYQYLVRSALLQRALDTAVTTLPTANTIAVPDGLADRIRAAITGTADPWDKALWRLVMQAHCEQADARGP